MNTHEMNYIGHNFIPGFTGVYSADNLPIDLKLPAYIIVNTQAQIYPGEHWCAIYFDQNRWAYFFDPYGLPPNSRIEAYLNRKALRWQHYQFQTQSSTSRACGLFCLYFLREVSITGYFSFSRNTTFNEYWMNKYFKYMLP